MDQIVVPQFLDVEDKIIGPITVRQFIEMLIGGMLVFIFYRIFDFSLFVLASIIVIVFTLVVAFVKINGQSFHYFILNLISTLKNPRLKVWRKDISDLSLKRAREKEPAIRLPNTMIRHQVSASRLSELALIVDTGGVYQGESSNFPNK